MLVAVLHSLLNNWHGSQRHTWESLLGSSVSLSGGVCVCV